MTSSKPYLGTSQDRLTALINAANGTNLVEGVDFTFGLPQATTGPRGENTKVVLTPCAGTLYKGPVTVYYNRLPITVLNDLPVGFVKPVLIDTFPFCMQNALGAIDDALGLVLLPEEVVNICYQTPQDHYPLTITDKSLAWLPGTLTFFAVSSAFLNLETLPSLLPGFSLQHTDLGSITTTVLPGFSSN
jgi:hypothetical protein